MSSQAIADAFDARLATFQGGGYIQYEDVPYTPIAGKPYLSARLSGYSRSTVSAGPDPVMQESGTYQVNVNRPSGEGRQAAGQIADKVVAHFPTAAPLTLPAGSLIVLYSSAGPGISAGDWYTVPVMVSWTATT